MLKTIKIIRLLLALLVCTSCKGNEPTEPPILEGDYVNRTVEFEKLPGWKFRCKVLGEKETVEDYGGRIEFMKKMDKLFVDASKYFCVKGLNDEGGNEIHFYMTEMVEFEGNSSTYMYDDRGAEDLTYDIRIVVNGNAAESDVSGGWLPTPYLAIGHDFDGLFEGYAIDALVHELGHSRGMIDLYATEVGDPNNNPVNGQTFEADRGIMNYCYGERLWSEYSKMMINVSADKRIATRHFEVLPQGYRATVLTSDGQVAKGAYLRFYPVYPYSYRVSPQPLYEGELSVTGNYVFTKNPFIQPNQSNPDHNIYNYLVEVEYNGEKTYKWMPIYEAELAYGRGTNIYTFTIKLNK